MPELPEVETVKETLKNQILGEKIISVDVFYEQIIDESSRIMFKELLLNETLTDILRYGKYLFFIFENVSLISHLRMEGKYFIKNINESRNVHEHIIFTFASGRTLRYHDTRKFGTMKLVQTTLFEEIMKEPELSKLGPEANTDIDIDEFYNQIKGKKIKLKTALLDQTLIAGLGNIYVDEVCFLSGLHPEYECSKLTKYQCMLILENSKYVLEGAIKAGGTTIRSYTSSLGVTGRFQLKLHVHTKEGSLCENCSTVIKKIQVGGRGTYFCEICQNKDLPLVVGITGGIGTGKSSVSNYIKSLGYEVIDTDVIARNITNENNEVITKIKDVFGEEYILDGKLNRAKMGKLVFNNKEANKKLTDIIHPIVKKEVLNKINLASGKIIFVDVPLLYESKFDELCHQVICVYTTFDVNTKRLMERDNITYEYAISKINSQMDINLKVQKAHFIIDNSEDLCYTYKQIDKTINKLNEMRK